MYWLTINTVISWATCTFDSEWLSCPSENRLVSLASEVWLIQCEACKSPCHRLCSLCHQPLTLPPSSSLSSSISFCHFWVPPLLVEVIRSTVIVTRKPSRDRRSFVKTSPPVPRFAFSVVSSWSLSSVACCRVIGICPYNTSGLHSRGSARPLSPCSLEWASSDEPFDREVYSFVNLASTQRFDEAFCLEAFTACCQPSNSHGLHLGRYSSRLRYHLTKSAWLSHTE